MASQNFMMNIKHLFYSWKRSIQSFFFHRETFSEKYRSQLIAGAVALSVAALGFCAYTWYKNNVNAQAQMAFSQAVESYNKALQSKNDDDWQAVAQVLQSGADTYKYSVFAPYFRTFYADVLIRQGKRDLALVEMTRAVQGLSNSSPLTPLFKIKEALLMIDAGTDGQRSAGVEKLTALAHDRSNIFSDQARYHLARYYWSLDDTQKAREEWESLASLGGDVSRMKSPWAEYAHDMLENFS